MGELILDGHKLAWHRERVEAWARGERVAPILIDCALTQKCTYKCVYCYATLQENEAMPISKEAFFAFQDDAAEIGVKAMSFVSDGESTCCPFVNDAIIHGKQVGLDMAMGTNGLLLDHARLPEALEALTYLRFNVSAADRSRYMEIHGVSGKCYDQVMENVRACVRIKRERGLKVTLGLQMVLMPAFADQIVPMAKLGKELGVDYTVIKHCSDDEAGRLGVDYSKYFDLHDLLREAETHSTADYLVKAKWSKIIAGRKRCYSKCYGPPLMLQMSGTGLVAPCGSFFNDQRYTKYHIGNITKTRFKDIWQSGRYWEVMDLIRSDQFDPRTMCGTLCLQHKVNEALWSMKEEGAVLPHPVGDPPEHLNFI